MDHIRVKNPCECSGLRCVSPDPLETNSEKRPFSDWPANQLSAAGLVGCLTDSLAVSPRLEPDPHVTLSRVKWMSTSSLLQSKRRGTEPLWGSATVGVCCGLWWSWLILLEVKWSRRPLFLALYWVLLSCLPSAWDEFQINNDLKSLFTCKFKILSLNSGLNDYVFCKLPTLPEINHSLFFYYRVFWVSACVVWRIMRIRKTYKAHKLLFSTDSRSGLEMNPGDSNLRVLWSGILDLLWFVSLKCFTGICLLSPLIFSGVFGGVWFALWVFDCACVNVLICQTDPLTCFDRTDLVVLRFSSWEICVYLRLSLQVAFGLLLAKCVFLPFNTGRKRLVSAMNIPTVHSDKHSHSRASFVCEFYTFCLI